MVDCEVVVPLIRYVACCEISWCQSLFCAGEANAPCIVLEILVGDDGGEDDGGDDDDDDGDDDDAAAGAGAAGAIANPSAGAAGVARAVVRQCHTKLMIDLNVWGFHTCRRLECA